MSTSCPLPLHLHVYTLWNQQTELCVSLFWQLVTQGLNCKSLNWPLKPAIDPPLGGHVHYYFGMKTSTTKIAMKFNLIQNWYLRTQYGQTGESELSKVQYNYPISQSLIH